MSKEVTVYGYNSVETSVLKNPESIIELYIDESSSNKLNFDCQRLSCTAQESGLPLLKLYLYKFAN